MDSKLSQHHHLAELLTGLSDESRVWVFQSNRSIEPQLLDLIQSQLNSLSNNWTSHAKELKAKIILVDAHFILVVLDHTVSSQASGCSIDAMTSSISSLGQSLGYDFMNRDIFYFNIEGEVKGVQLNLIQENISTEVIHPKSLVYDSLVKTKKQLIENWLVPLEESWHKRFL